MTQDRPGRLHIERLKLADFRNYAALNVELAPGPVVLTGENGAGKTNLLEAISFLSPGRGFRRASLTDVARAGAPSGFAVHARLQGPFGEVDIGTGTSGIGDATETGRKVRINGEPARTVDELLDWLRVIWLTPAMDALFTGPAAERRRFLDRLVLAIDPGHGRRSNAFERSMRSRNRLLTDGVADPAWFEAIETQMAEQGVAIAAARMEMVRLLCAMTERLPADGPFPRAVLALSGSIEERLLARAAVDVEEDYRQFLMEGRHEDRIAGRTLQGPHRSDLLVRHAPKNQPAELCSTGEQKALLVGLILGHARLTADVAGTAPILLLDEIAAHFDAGRRAALFEILDDLHCQHFMTGTETALFESLFGRAQFLSVREGAITAHDPA